MASKLEGFDQLARALRALGDPKQQAGALRASMRKPALSVIARARANIARISPGKTAIHRTYQGRIVARGFAARSLGFRIRLSRDKTAVVARIGVAKEAFYAVQFFELGTAKIPKQPWLVPAFRETKDQAVELIGDTLLKNIVRLARKRGFS